MVMTSWDAHQTADGAPSLRRTPRDIQYGPATKNRLKPSVFSSGSAGLAKPMRAVA